MSNTVVKDFPPTTKSADNALVIVVGEDGSLSVDPETLNNLINKGSQNTEVSIIRMSGTGTGNDEVDATLETFLETSYNIDTSNILEPPQTNHKKMDELTIDIGEISRMCRNIQMDHCYTPLTSPSQKLETIHKNSDLIQSQTLNKSTEDLMAVLEADNEPITKPPAKVTPLLTPVDSTNQLLAKLEKTNETINVPQVITKPSVITTTTSTAGLIQTVSKPVSGANLTTTPAKKTLKIVTVTKPATGIRNAMTSTPPQIPPTSSSIKEPIKEQLVQKLTVKETVKESPQTSVNNDSKLQEDLSDISSDSDFEMDDDSEDSDFDAGKQKISKPKYKTFGSKRNKLGANRKRDKSQNKILNRSAVKLKKIQENKDLPKSPLVVKTNKIVRNKSKTILGQEEPITPATPIPPTIPQQEVVSPLTDKQDQSKKLPKKKVPKPVELFDDGIALFSTPDVIRRVSVSGDSPIKVSEPNTKPRTQSVDQKVEDRTETSNKTKDDSTKVELRVDKALITSEVDSTTPMDATEQALAGLDNANLDLDLNADELIPEDLLFQVAKLVENADIQKVIDTNLTLVDQNLDNLDSVLPKTNESFVQKDIENMNMTENTQQPTTNEIQTKLQQKSENKVQIASSTIQAPVGNLISKNNTNKPIQIVRPDGRVIIIPPIEKPATRSSKRKQGGDNNTSTTQVISDADTNTTTVSTPTLQNTSVISTGEHEKSKQNVDSSRSEQLQSTNNVADDSDISDSDESWKSEDDPDRLWCICKQPHNNRFMICCDTCEEWFHGQCVGVSKALGRQMEQQGKEWQCPNCQKVKKNALQQALSEVQQATVDLLTPAAPTTTPQQNVVQSLEDTEKPVQRCIVCKGPSRSGSVYCSESCIVQHSNAVERVIVFERATGRCLSGNNAPTVANLKQWLKQHPGFEVVSSGNKTLTQSKLQLNKTGVNKNSQQSQKVQGKQMPGSNKQPPHILNHQLGKGLLQKSQQSFYGKQNSQTPNKQLSNSATTTPVKSQPAKMVTSTPLPQVKSVKIIQPHTLTVKTPQTKQQKTNPPATPPTTPQTPKQNPLQDEEKPTVKKKTPITKPTTTPQKVSRQKSVSSVTEDNRQQKGPEQLRGNVRKTLAEHLLLRLKEQEEIKMSEESVKKLSEEIEAELYSLFNKDTGAKYRNRYRSLIFNIKDSKNETLWKRICQKAVSPKQLVRLLPEELASQELAQWRERETKHQLDMIKKTELDLLSCVRTYVLKSHKGEEVIEKRVDAVDSTIVADLDASLNNEERIADSTTDRSGSQDRNSKDSSKNKSSDHKHRRESSSSHHKSSRDRSSRKHRDGSHDRKRRSRSKDRSKDRRSSDSKKSRHRSRSGSRHKSSDRDKSRHKDKHDHKNKSSSKHKHNNSSRHKDSESDSTTSSNTTKNSTRDLNKSDTTDLLTMGLDKKSKEILESLVDNKVVDNRILRDDPLLAPLSTVTADSESDHEPSSTVNIATPPRSADIDSTPVDKQSRTSIDTVAEEPPRTPELTGPSESIEKKIISAPSKSISIQPTSADGPIIWKGFINMIDVAKFRITAQEVSGDCISLAKELSASLDIVGRISPDTVWEYLSKMRRSTAKYISILRLMPENSDEQSAYQSLYTYLSSRKRFGVVKTANTSIKDFYIMPQASYNPLPQVLLPISGPGFEESRPNLLLGILVSSKRKRPQIYETSATILAKKIKESSPPRSYTPPPSDIKDPRIAPPKTNLISSIVMPPLPTVAPIPPPEISKPDPPPLDDMDEPYSPGDSDDALPTIPVNIIKTKTPAREKEKILPPPPPQVVKPVVSELSILDPFKTSNYPTIPGLDAAPPPSLESTSTCSLDVLNLLNSTINSTSIINLDPSPVSTPSLSTEIAASTNLDALALQRNIDEINKRIERERQEIDSISMGIVQKKDIESSLANIALPSNLQQILDSIKTKKCDETENITGIIPKDKEETSPIEEYTPGSNTLTSSSIPSYAPTSSTTKASTPVIDDDESLPTIPLLLPKLPRPSLESKPNISDLNIPLNLPISKRVPPSSGIKRPANDSDLLTDVKRKHLDTSSELPQIPLKLPLVSKKSFSHPTSSSPSKMTVENSHTKPSSVLSSLSTEELIRKANEMLAAQDDKVEDEDDDESFDSTESPIKQAPVLYPNTVPSQTMRYMEQPPVPGLEDYE